MEDNNKQYGRVVKGLDGHRHSYYPSDQQISLISSCYLGIHWKGRLYMIPSHHLPHEDAPKPFHATFMLDCIAIVTNLSYWLRRLESLKIVRRNPLTGMSDGGIIIDQRVRNDLHRYAFDPSLSESMIDWEELTYCSTLSFLTLLDSGYLYAFVDEYPNSFQWTKQLERLSGTRYPIGKTYHYGSEIVLDFDNEEFSFIIHHYKWKGRQSFRHLDRRLFSYCYTSLQLQRAYEGDKLVQTEKLPSDEYTTVFCHSNCQWKSWPRTQFVENSDSMVSANDQFIFPFPKRRSELVEIRPNFGSLDYIDTNDDNEWEAWKIDDEELGSEWQLLFHYLLVHSSPNSPHNQGHPIKRSRKTVRGNLSMIASPFESESSSASISSSSSVTAHASDRQGHHDGILFKFYTGSTDGDPPTVAINPDQICFCLPFLENFSEELLLIIAKYANDRVIEQHLGMIVEQMMLLRGSLKLSVVPTVRFSANVESYLNHFNISSRQRRKLRVSQQIYNGLPSLFKTSFNFEGDAFYRIHRMAMRAADGEDSSDEEDSPMDGLELSN